MFSKLFNRRKQDENSSNLPLPSPIAPKAFRGANWSFLGTDMHSHFIPGIDDGAKTIDDSLVLLRAMKAMGYKNIITTPHVMIDYYPNSKEIIQNGLLSVQNAIKENDIDISIKAAAEYYIDESFIKLIDKEPLLTIYKNEVLVEFSMLYEPPMLFDVIFKMQSAGYRPVIAHPERYLFFHQNFKKYRELKEIGCLLQLNMLSIAGYYGRHIKTIAGELLTKRLYDYCGSDIHHERQAAALNAMTETKDYPTFVNYPFLNSRLC